MRLCLAALRSYDCGNMVGPKTSRLQLRESPQGEITPFSTIFFIPEAASCYSEIPRVVETRCCGVKSQIWGSLDDGLSLWPPERDSTALVFPLIPSSLKLRPTALRS